jgi:hypothetical protein
MVHLSVVAFEARPVLFLFDRPIDFFIFGALLFGENFETFGPPLVIIFFLLTFFDPGE